MAGEQNNWEIASFELPPGWKEQIDRVAYSLNGGKRGLTKYLATVAFDLALTMAKDDPEALEDLVWKFKRDDARESTRNKLYAKWSAAHAITDALDDLQNNPPKTRKKKA